MPEPISATVAFVTAAYSSAVAATATVLGAMGTVGALGMGGTYALAGAIVKGGIMMGLSAASAALLRPDVPSSGTTLDFKPDPKAPVRGAMGYTALGGNKVFQATWGYKKVAMSLGVALSLGPIDQVPHFEADGATVSFSGPQNEATGFYAADMWQRTTLGLPGDAALLPPTGLKYGNPGLTGWGTQHAAPQVSFSFWTMVLAKNPEDRDVFTNGVPDPRWIGRWMKLWDPRKDSTYPGGSGPQRRDDWRTWEWSESPYVHALAWCRGHYKLNLDGTIDRTKRIAGIGAPDAAIDIPAFVEGMNVAQANDWTISGEWSTSDGKFQTLLAMLQAGGGEPISRGAQISVMVNAPRVATYTYTRDDLIGQAEIRPLTPRRERKNTIVPRYKSEANGWQYVPAGEVTSSVYRDEDRGEPRSLEIEYTHVRSAKQAGQLAAYDLANLREGLTATLPSKVHLMHVHPGDCITVDVPELALAGQKFVVRRATVNHQAASVTLELRSESDGKHAWALGQAAQPAPSPSLSAVDPKYVPPPAPEDWTAVPKPPGEGGVSQPIVIIELPIETTDIIAVIIKHGPGAAGPWTDGYEGSPRTDGRYEVAGLTPGQTYCFSLQYVAKNGAKSEPDIKCGIVAPDLVAGDTTHMKGEPVQDILDKLTDTADLTAANAAAVADMGDRVDGVIAEAEDILAGAEGAAALAVLKAGEAGEAAEASNTAAGIATTKADEAGASAQAANVEKLAAEAARDGTVGVALSQMPASVDRQFWTSQGSAGAPLSLPDVPSSDWQIVDDPDLGRCWTATTAGGAGGINLTPKGVLQRAAGRKYEVSFSGKIVTLAPDGTTNIQVLVGRLDGAYADVASRIGLAAINRSTTGLFEFSAIIDCDLTSYQASTFLRPSISANRSDGAPIETRIGPVKIEDVTAREAAKAAASASVLASAQAEAFAGDAGDWAAASEGAAVQAAARAAEGLTYRNQAVDARDGAVAANISAGTSASAAASERQAAEDARDDAAASSATSLAHSSTASAAAADAKLSANLAAQIGGGSLNQNPTFTAWSGALPDGYGVLSAANGTYTKVSGRNGQPNALRTASAGTADFGFNQFVEGAKAGGEWVVLEVDVSLEAGSFAGSGIAMSSRTASGALVTHNYSFMAEFGAGATGRAYRFSRLVDLRHANAVRYGVNAWTRWSTFAPSSAATLDWQRVSVRPATEGEIAAGTVLPAVEAQLAIVADVAASADGTAKAIHGVVMDVNGYVSGYGSVNDGVTSAFEVLAENFGVRDPGSGERTEYRSGNWYVYSPSENTRTRYGKAFGGTQKLVWWTGPSSVAEGSETKANAYVYMSQNTVSGPRFGGSDVPINGFHVQADSAVRVGTRTTAGLVTTSLVTITASGNTDTVSYDWSQIGGEETWTITAPSGPATAFRINVSSPGEIKRAQFACLVRDSGSGKSFTIIVGATAIYNV